MAHPEVVDRLAILNVAIRPLLLRALRAPRLARAKSSAYEVPPIARLE
jgi:hypothetical protein